MKKSSRIVLITILSIALFILIIACAYVIYVLSSYERIEDQIEENVTNNQERRVKEGEEYTITTYNIGFGAYSQDYSFFMDSGYMSDGTKVTGKYAKGISKEETLKNTEGAISYLKEADTDFIFLQEVDEKANRSYFVDQRNMIEKALPGYASVFSINFDTAYLLYPFHDPIGKTLAGLLSLSKYHIVSAVRYSYPVSSSLSKLFDLDRCFTLIRVPSESGKELVLINSHMSAYDKGGVIREKQLNLLLTTLKEEREKGNWVIAGGDFNHILGENAENIYTSDQLRPDWIASISLSDIPEGFKLSQAENLKEVATCRDAEIPYEKGVNYISTIDGFIVSDNVEIKSWNIDTDFMYSDHNPVYMKFTLK